MRSRRLAGWTRKADGQAITEFAFVLPVFMLVVFVTIQISLLFVAYYSETRMARETSRWLAVNRNATDLSVAQHVQSTALPGIAVAAPVLVSDDNSTAHYKVGRMDAVFTACGAGTPPPCSNDHRGAGSTLSVTLTYDASNLMFLPTTFRFGWLSTTVPTSVPAYRVSTMVE